MSDGQASLDAYSAELDPKKKGNIFEKLVASALERRYRRKIRTERNLGSGIIFDGLTTIRGVPIIIEIKHRERLASLSHGTTSTQLPTQIEMAVSNSGVYELVIAPHTTIGSLLIDQLAGLERLAALMWRVSEFNPATGKFAVRHASRRLPDAFPD